MSRNIYLENTPLSEALSRWLTRLDSEGITTPFSGDTISVLDALGRVTAEAVIARVSSPFYHSSAMDGYAVRFTDTFGASERTPMKLRIGSGAAPVNTGDPMPDGFNAVVWVGVKCQSNLEIAGSLRNSFRASLKVRVLEVEH